MVHPCTVAPICEDVRVYNGDDVSIVLFICWATDNFFFLRVLVNSVSKSRLVLF